MCRFRGGPTRPGGRGCVGKPDRAASVTLFRSRGWPSTWPKKNQKYWLTEKSQLTWWTKTPPVAVDKLLYRQYSRWDLTDFWIDASTSVCIRAFDQNILSNDSSLLNWCEVCTFSIPATIIVQRCLTPGWILLLLGSQWRWRRRDTKTSGSIRARLSRQQCC